MKEQNLTIRSVFRSIGVWLLNLRIQSVVAQKIPDINFSDSFMCGLRSCDVSLLVPSICYM